MSANRLLGYFIVCLRKIHAPYSFVDLSPGKLGGSAEIKAADRVVGRRWLWELTDPSPLRRWRLGAE